MIDNNHNFIFRYDVPYFRGREIESCNVGAFPKGINNVTL